METRVTLSTEWLNFGLITDSIFFLECIPLWYIKLEIDKSISSTSAFYFAFKYRVFNA
jgi:hypothetical protein